MPRSFVLVGTGLLMFITLATNAFASGLDLRVGTLDLNVPLGGLGVLDGLHLGADVPGGVVPDASASYTSGRGTAASGGSGLAQTSTEPQRPVGPAAPASPAAGGTAVQFPMDTLGLWLLVIAIVVALVLIAFAWAAFIRHGEARDARRAAKATRAASRASVRPIARTASP